jgi:hypothetical protein
MFFFKKKSDPLAEELQRLEKERRRLERQVSAIEYALQNPPEPELPPADDEPPANRGAKFVHDPPPEQPTVSGGRGLKIQRAKARQRMIWLCLGLIFLALVVYRCGRAAIGNP